MNEPTNAAPNAVSETADALTEGGLSPFALKVKRWYEARPQIYTKQMVYNLVGKGKITAAEYEIITGEPYVAPKSKKSSKA